MRAPSLRILFQLFLCLYQLINTAWISDIILMIMGHRAHRPHRLSHANITRILPNVVGVLSRRRFLLVKGRTLRHEALLDSFKFRQVANATWPGQLMGAPQSRYSAGCRSESALEPINWNEATIRNPAQMRQTGAQWIDRIING